MDNSLSSERWRYMVATGLWPKKANFDPAAWMTNFSRDEQPLALRLLEGFTFFSDELVKQMFRSAFLNLSAVVVSNKDDYSGARREWSSFVDSMIVVRVTGEIPSDADSGFTFSRFARDFLQLPENRIAPPDAALNFLIKGGEGNILFVDDFVGSGNQFGDTWDRQYATQAGIASFKSVASMFPAIRFFYCPVICTDLGRKNINHRCGSKVRIVPSHFFGSRQSAISEDSSIWREDMQTEGPEFVKRVSQRAGIPDLDGQEGCWRGFHKLGLALAFAHGYPDATLPLFYADQHGWKPLIRKGTL
ncbi:hypothetical protein LMG26684_02787 [Achromobacter mucicolens]|uniref:phosphoribosyltransferase-like protein n=1 Tax=Achromobacter mucicolens TaxID=1389922 RepID=UPI0014695A8E|nr:hypothetical protein [Achromobacter mucicolens]CAB3865294.1 hypothetical protein LMG26684_02787 [Achromobacter mucicolens]